MEHALTCNNLKCKKELGDRALVTTCSHIFCLECVRRFGLSTQETPRGVACPACNSQLAKPDDAVFANLNPSEDYKTSILSGLSPNVIMECAGRALSFWAYQTAQQISYQQYLCKTLTEKYSSLKIRLDQTAKDADIELERLQQKLDSSAAEHDSMRRRNEELAQAYRDKSRKLLQTQELYDKAKRKAEIGHIQRAASDAVDSTLHAEPPSQRTAVGFEGHHAKQGQGYRNTFASYARGDKFDASNAYSSIFKSDFRHAASEERWPGSGQVSANGGFVSADPDERNVLRNQPYLGLGSLPRYSTTPVPLGAGHRRSADVPNPGFLTSRSAVSGLGLSSGLKVSQPAAPDGMTSGSARSHRW